MTSLAISTGWNSKRHAEARAVVDEILSLGVDCVEAGYALTPKQLEGLLECRQQVRIVSVHNFCPIPASHKRSWGDDFLLSSLDDEERAIGVAATCETIDWATRLGAKVLVMHLGQVDMDISPCRVIKQWIAEGNMESSAIALKVNEAKKTRAPLAPCHLEAVRRSIDEILRKTRGTIVLGFENRSDYYEIPNVEEMDQLLAAYGSAVGYWHDVGHAFMQEIMGFYPPNEHIRSFCDRMVGTHLHDSLRVSDHRAPGYGEIDYETSLKPYLKHGVLKVLELHPRTTLEEAKSGIEFLHKGQIIQ